MRNFLYIFGILFLNTSYGQEEQTLPEAIAKDTLQSVAVKDSLPQETTLTALERGREFVIGGIEVKGAKHYNAQTIIVASGLKVGDKITIPSERFTRIIHKLWNYQVFNDIDIYIAKTEGNKVFLEFVIQEMPELTEVKIEGIRKRKGEELLKNIESNIKTIRYELGTRVHNQLRIIPELRFFIDDSLDYIERIDELLKK